MTDDEVTFLPAEDVRRWVADLDAQLAENPPAVESAVTVAPLSVLAIDPGTHQSAWVYMSDRRLIGFGISSNDSLLTAIRERQMPARRVVIEKVASYGMPVGADVFETVFWSGRFAEAADPIPVERPTRKEIVTHLCGSARAKDSNVRQALIDRYGGPSTVRKGGPLSGVAKDVWAALAVAVTYLDKTTRLEETEDAA
jgi:hypothetical protein